MRQMALLVCWLSLSATTIAAGDRHFAELFQLLEDAEFVLATDEQIAQSRAELMNAMSERPTGISSDDWEYLDIQEVREALRNGDEDETRSIEFLVNKLNQDFPGFDGPQMLGLQRRARRHLSMLADRQNPDLEPLFRRVKPAMRDALKRFELTGDAGQHHRLATGIRWLEQHRLSVEFVQAAKRELSFPNLEIHLPAAFVRTLSTKTTERAEPLNRFSEGILTRGTVHLQARGYLEPADADDRGMLALRFHGRTQLSAINVRDRICFRSTALTNTWGDSRITVDNDALLTHASPQVCSTTELRNSKVHVDRCIGKRVIGFAANRVIAKKTPELEATLSKEVSDRVRTELSTQLTELVGKANTFVNEEVWARARRFKVEPRQLSIQTTSDALKIAGIEDQQCGLGAPAPRSWQANGLGVAALHETFATDLLNVIYARKRGPPELDADILETMNRKSPFKAFAETQRTEDVRLYFALDLPRPFRLGFHQDIVRLTIRATSMTLDDRTYPAQDIMVAYRISLQPGNELNFRLLGKPQVSPRRGAERTAIPELSDAVRGELFASLLPEFSVALEDLYNEGGIQTRLPLEVRSVNAKQGWLDLMLSATAPDSSRSP